MRKLLINIEGIDEFILAIASGADVNGIYKDQTLLEYCFDAIYNSAYQHFFKSNVDFKKYSALLAGGADTAPLIVNKAKQLHDLIYWTSRCCNLLSVLSKNEDFFETLRQREDLAKLQDEVELLSPLLAKSIPLSSQPQHKETTTENDSDMPALLKAKITLISSGLDSIPPDKENQIINRYAAAIVFDKCMRGISVWDKDVSFAELEKEINGSFDFSELFAEDWNPPFTLSMLLKRTLEFLQVIRKTITGQNALPNLNKLSDLTGTLGLLYNSMQSLKQNISGGRV